MESFTAQRGRVRVVFGVGSAACVADELANMDASRPLWVCSARGERDARAYARGADVLATARPQVPGDIADAAAGHARARGTDVVVGFGGGSPIGLAKAIALACDVRVAAVPTTYAGSEMTPIYGITRDGHKTTGRDERVRPVLVVYDPALTLALPAPTSVTSAINAMAHAVEALYAAGASEAVRDDAGRSLRALATAIPRLVANAADTHARGDALYGAHLAGASLADATMGLHHKLCHVLGGTFGLPHAQTHTVILPHVIAYNAAAAPDAMARIADALGVADPARGMWELARAAGAPTDLASLGFDRADIARAADLTTRAEYPNPRPVERDAVCALLERAVTGQPPESPAL